EKGPEKFFHGYNIRSTAERLIKETGGASVAEHKISPELAQSSYFRPRIYDFEADSLQANYPQISFSDYYYSEGEYRVKVYNHGDLVGSLSLGKELPNDSVIRISLADIGNVAADQLRLYVAMMASPPMLVDMATTYLWGENLLTSMPVVEDFLQSIDPWDHEAHVSMGDIIVGVEASYDAKAFKADTGYNSIIIKRK
ncbi:MAG: hypothetical protein ABFC62_12175, partial [Clostridiaceae bacterium]|nr:hypothetical protein [Eubacteriales bacterium]